MRRGLSESLASWLSMCWTGWRRERAVRRVLKALARQRVSLMLEPGAVPVVECSLPAEEWAREGLWTCRLRGWAEPCTDPVFKGKVGPEGALPQRADGYAPLYRVTSAGWDQLRRTHWWVVGTFCMAALAVIVGLGSFLAAASHTPPVAQMRTQTRPSYGVRRVIDGDTTEIVDAGGIRTRVRLRDVAAPELD